MLNASKHQAAGLAHWRARITLQDSSSQPSEEGPARCVSPFRVLPVLSALPSVGRHALLRQMVIADLRSGGRPLVLNEETEAEPLFQHSRSPRPDLLEFLDGQVAFETLVGLSADRIRVISAELGLSSLALRPIALARFLDQVASRDERVSTLWINARATREGVVCALAELGTDVIIVTTPDSDAMTATYQLAKRLSERQMMQLRVLYNCATAEQALRAHEGLADAAQRFIGLRVDCLGNVPFDPLLVREGSVPPGVRRRPVHLAAAGGARRAIDRVLRELSRTVSPSLPSNLEHSNV